MTNIVILPLVGLAGIVLGLVFFGGLWWTVRKGLSSDSIAWWFCGSFLIRMGVVLSGFILVSDGRWERMVACLLGFLSARMAIAWLTRLPTTNRPPAISGVTHEP